MKRVIAIILALAMCITVTSCKTQSLTEQEPSSSASSKNITTYSDIASSCQKAIVEAVPKLNSMFNYQYNYIEALEKVGGSATSESILGKSLEHCGYTLDDLSDDYDRISTLYQKSSSVVIEENNQHLQDLLNGLFEGYVGYYNAIINPATSSSSYSVSIASNYSAIKDNNNYLNSFLGTSFVVDETDDAKEETKESLSKNEVTSSPDFNKDAQGSSLSYEPSSLPENSVAESSSKITSSKAASSKSEKSSKPESSKPKKDKDNEPKGSNKSGHYYITKSGKCYHYLKKCGGKNAFEVSWSEAKHLRPCKKCVH